MNNKFNCTCIKEKVLSSYSLSEDKKFVTSNQGANETEYCPFDNVEKLVVDYLNIGYIYTNGGDTTNLVLSFVSSYGMPQRKMKKLDIADFSEGAEALYLHFAEISTKPYPKNPEWVLEPEPVSGVVIGSGEVPVLQWQTGSLADAIELGYTILVCNDIKKLGICKHCFKPFYAKNPKSEFCSPVCRNRYNVYKSRSKNS